MKSHRKRWLRRRNRDRDNKAAAAIVKQMKARMHLSAGYRNPCPSWMTPGSPVTPNPATDTSISPDAL